MRFLLLCSIFLGLLLTPLLTIAQVQRSQLTSNINEREPVDTLTEDITLAPGEVRKVFFFTHISDLANQQITHRWLYQGDEKAAVNLHIGSDNWRTYSSKMIPSYWAGEWQVQVWYGDLQLITHNFTVTVEQ
ncbi:MAG: DUF2914 domain-containing protein [Paraglaciecola sp.]|nr:DUF2914 domain-containing protein [Paraglaciecola sp.]NCT49205.1 DUF2914 domain-containing protein [Paraglaciecola sp.]